MPPKYRLSRADFIRISAKRSRRIHGSYFTLSITSHEEKGPKIACVVSKKNMPRAVDRKKTQRRCREILRPHLSRIDTNVALLFYGKRGAATAAFAEVKHDIETLLTHAHPLASSA